MTEADTLPQNPAKIPQPAQHTRLPQETPHTAENTPPAQDQPKQADQPVRIPRPARTRAAAHRAAKAVKTPEEQRQLALDDLFCLLVYQMNRPDMDNDWCFARCREVQKAPNGFLDLWAREHYKSTIITVGKTIQDILADPEITVGIFSHTRPIAKAFLRQIKREFESNQLLRELFPHIAPPVGKNPRTWSEDGGLVVERATNPKEATVEAWGLVDGQPTGKHFSLLVYDDVVTRESVSSPEMIAKVTDAWALSLNLGAHGGQRRHIGTRYHFNDTYRTIMERGAAKPRIYPATTDGKAEGEPVFLNRESLAAKRRDMGPYVFGCQMLQDPSADRVQGFKNEWLQFATVQANQRISHSGMNLYLLVDPAGSKKEGSDYSVFALLGLGPDNNYYLVEALRDRLNLTERAAALFRLHRQYRPLAVGYERYGMQADIEHIKAEQERQGYRFPIVELGGSMPKNDRIRRLIPLFEQGRFYLPQQLVFVDSEGKARDFTREFIDEEYTAFPVSGHDDMLDCLARIVEPELGAMFPLSRQEEKHATCLVNTFNPYEY